MYTHPKGPRARVLLTSVFGPFAQDDQFGSRRINPMELYHNQVTRVQGPFSLRMFHRSWGIMLIRDNLRNPTTLLDFPSRESFVAELERHPYDVVGITSIQPNVGKVAEMCRLIRLHSPHSQIVVGGHVASMPDLGQRIDADHIVRGEGVAWMRRYLGQPDGPLKHPDIISSFGARMMGFDAADRGGDAAATVIPSVGCPVGCNFCATSSLFGGKGKFVNLFATGDELFEIMDGLERRLGVQSFFVMDENFLLHYERAQQLLRRMEQEDKSWSLYVFSSARAIRRYSMEELARLGISWVWMGLEGEDSQYGKLRGVDTRQLVSELQSHGIRVLGSSIIGLEEHTPQNIDAAIDHAVRHRTDFHQFMLYTPLPGTPLHREHRANGTLLEVDPADVHGQDRFNFRHPHITREQSQEFLLRAFERDYRVNGPSLTRVAATMLRGWQRFRHHSAARVVRRYEREIDTVRKLGAGMVWAARRYFPSAAHDHLLGEIYASFGWKTRLFAPVIGMVCLASLHLENWRLRRGWTREPQSFREETPGKIDLDHFPAGEALVASERGVDLSHHH